MTIPYNGFSGPERDRLGRWQYAQFKSGRLKRPGRCTACGQDEGIIDAHVEDYSEPYELPKSVYEYALCYRCHMMVHCRFNNRRAWERYKALVNEGTVFVPFKDRKFGLFKSQHLNRWSPAVAYVQPAPERRTLDEIDGWVSARPWRLARLLYVQGHDAAVLYCGVP
jgi:hypothetical protein